MANSKLSCTKLSFILNEYKVKENVNSLIGLKVICHSIFSISTAHNLNTTFALTVWIWAETQHVIIYQINSFFKTNTTRQRRAHWLGDTLYWQWISQFYEEAMHILLPQNSYFVWQMLATPQLWGKKTTKQQTIWIENSLKIILSIVL